MILETEAVVVHDMQPESCEFPSLDICQKRFLWAHKEVDLVPHLVVLVPQIGEAGKFNLALGLKILDPFLRRQ